MSVPGVQPLTGLLWSRWSMSWLGVVDSCKLHFFAHGKENRNRAIGQRDGERERTRPEQTSESESKFVQLISISTNRIVLGPAHLRDPRGGATSAATLNANVDDGRRYHSNVARARMVPVAAGRPVPDVRGVHRHPAARPRRHRCLWPARERKH